MAATNDDDDLNYDELLCLDDYWSELARAQPNSLGDWKSTSRLWRARQADEAQLSSSEHSSGTQKIK